MVRLDEIKEYTDGVKDLFHPKAKVIFSLPGPLALSVITQIHCSSQL
jgi:hypothetical protein